MTEQTDTSAAIAAAVRAALREQCRDATPGPWRLDEWGLYGINHQHILWADGGGIIVATRADRALILAAPDLLATTARQEARIGELEEIASAARQALRLWVEADDGYGNDPLEWENALSNLRAALTAPATQLDERAAGEQATPNRNVRRDVRCEQGQWLCYESIRLTDDGEWRDVSYMLHDTQASAQADADRLDATDGATKEATP